MHRAEHPRPQFMRENWRNLNGTWDFEFDHGDSGLARGLAAPDAAFSHQIQVPFCPQSKLSGIGYTDFMQAVWYRREIELTEAELAGRVFIHFGAVDYSAEVFVNGKSVGTHKGGYVSFKFDITDFVHEGKNTISLCARDDERNRLIPSGKQSMQYASRGCHYTRTTGIWQTVWLEFVPQSYIKSAKFYPDLAAGTVSILADVAGSGTFAAATTYTANGN